ncbi:MAG: MMPL family transporter [Verrucomicrobiae bacterium]|nr:MMPL family transporter [Verrucomicrobiae bacterium]
MKRAGLIAGLVVALLAVAGWTRLRWDADVLNTLPAQEPAVRGLQLHQRHFAAADELIVRVRAATEEEATDAARALALHLRQQTSQVASAWWQPPLEEAPSALAALVAEAWLHAPPERVERLRAELAPDALPARLAAARERLATSLTPSELARLSYDPLELSHLLEAAVPVLGEESAGAAGFQSPDGRSRFVWVKARVPLRGYCECRAWLNQMQALIHAWRQAHDPPTALEIGFTGRPAFMAEIGGGMERDLAGPALGTLAIIGALFFAVHRAWRPLLWLIALLVLNFVLTLGLGGWLFGSMNVVSLGFAAILMGLAADYAIVLLQEARTHPGLPVEEVQRRTRAAIFWSAATTAGAFLLLNFSGLPGLGQLGTLVAMGIALAAVLITCLYLPPLQRALVAAKSPPSPSAVPSAPRVSRAPVRLWASAILGCLCALVLISAGPPPFQRTTEALRPKHSPAYAVWNEFKQATSAGHEPLLLLLQATSATELYEAAQALRRQGDALAARGVIRGMNLPLELVMDAPWRSTNTHTLLPLAAHREALLSAAAQTGFTTNALALTLQVLDYWAGAGDTAPAALPAAVLWLRDRCYAFHEGRRVLLGVIHPTDAATPDDLNFHAPASTPVEMYVTNWEWMGGRLAALMTRELPWLLAAIGGMVLLALGLAFRSWRELVLSLAALLFSLLLLLAWMRVAGWPWNMMNLMALPLILGLGVDYCLHLLLGLQRHGGDWRATHQAVGRALLLAGATTVAAFGSLGFSSNAGVASLGQITATGVTACLITALVFLPAWESWSRQPAGRP